MYNVCSIRYKLLKLVYTSSRQIVKNAEVVSLEFAGYDANENGPTPQNVYENDLTDRDDTNMEPSECLGVAIGPAEWHVTMIGSVKWPDITPTTVPSHHRIPRIQHIRLCRISLHIT